MNIQTASQESALTRHLKQQADLAFVIEWLTKFDGADLHFNRYSETIIHLSGILKGMRMADNNQDWIQYEKSKIEPTLTKG